MTDEETKKVLSEVSKKVHKVLMSRQAKDLLNKEGHKMPQLIYDKLLNDKMEPTEEESILCDVFETCVKALIELGDPEASINECKSTDVVG